MFANAITASKLAPNADPVLKPNQLNHNNPAFQITKGILAVFLQLFSFYLKK